MNAKSSICILTFAGLVLLKLPVPATAQTPMKLPAPLTAQTPLRNVADPRLTQGFSVVLVLGDLKGDSAISSDVPAGARRALADMKDFLPYRSYKLLDTAWILSNMTGGHASSRLRGPDGVDYDVTISAGTTLRNLAGYGGGAAAAGSNEDVLSVKFLLSDPGTKSQDATASAATETVRRYERELADLRVRYGAQNPEVLSKTAELDAARAQVGRTGRVIIDTSFNMNGNETVVVGTSRVQGDTALIALLTAVPRSGTK
jgi:hypothetical protein